MDMDRTIPIRLTRARLATEVANELERRGMSFATAAVDSGLRTSLFQETVEGSKLSPAAKSAITIWLRQSVQQLSSPMYTKSSAADMILQELESTDYDPTTEREINLSVAKGTELILRVRFK